MSRSHINTDALEAALSASGMTANAASEAADCERGYVRDLLRGRIREPGAAKLARLEKVLGVEAGELMTPAAGCPPAEGAEIRALREAAGLTQAQLAEAIGTSQQTVDRIERGETRWSRSASPALTFLRLARSGAVKPDDGPSPAITPGNTDVVVPAQLEIRVHLGGHGDVIIQMVGDEADGWVAIRPEYVDAVVAAMLRVKAEALSQ